MVVEVLDIPTDNTEQIQLPANTPQWLKPYLAAAQRSGLLADLQTDADLSQPITGAEAAVILQNALDLPLSADALQQVDAMDEEIPDWALASLTVMAENGVVLEYDAPLTRAVMAESLYQISRIAPDAPGMTVFRMQQ